MQKWEYTWFTAPEAEDEDYPKIDAKGLKAKLTQAGSKGWELVVVGGDGWTFFFKRPTE